MIHSQYRNAWIILQKLYVFGENQKQDGLNTPGGGQAVIRGCKNALGFCTLKAIGEYWADDNFEKNKHSIDLDIMTILSYSTKIPVFPK